MKKLILLAAALISAVACTNAKPGDTPPAPVGDPVINITSIKMKALVDTVHLIVDNYSGDVEISTENPNFFIDADSETEPGVIILSSLTFGSTDMYIKCGAKTFTIPCKFEQAVTEPFYTRPLIAFGKTVDEVIALEVARGNDGTPTKGYNKEKTFYSMTIPAKTPNKRAANGEKFSYHFPVDTTTKEILSCVQSTVLSEYGAAAAAEDLCVMAWFETTESNYYLGTNPDLSNLDCALNREMTHMIAYQAGKSPMTNLWSFEAHYLEIEITENAHSKAAASAKTQLVEGSYLPFAKTAKKRF